MRTLHRIHGYVPAASAVIALVLLAGCSGSSADGGQPAGSSPATALSSSASPVTAQATIYASATPPNAPTQQMTLYHVDVPPGAVIAPHQHPGQQISHVTAGTLTYTVIAETVTVVDPPVDGKPGPAKAVTAPATIEVTAGQTLTEPAGEIHQATNAGTGVVSIDIAILVPLGDPLSVPAN
jgi:quercetin dioxygenase-like cupin family protein